MKKVIGYILAFAGLVGLFLSSSAGVKFIPFMENLEKTYVLIPSLILLALGVVIMIASGSSEGFFGGKTHQIQKEVPIYKCKKIVGYRVE